MARFKVPTGLGKFLRKRSEQKRETEGFQAELLQAEFRQASPFGNPELARRRAASGEEFKPVRGSVSEGAFNFFQRGGRATGKVLTQSFVESQGRSSAERKQKISSEAVKKSRAKRKASSVMDVNATVNGTKNKLGV